MVSNKNRLYIALYPTGVVHNEERRYHWAFLIGPKVENKPEVPGVRYHVKNHPVQGWVYEEVSMRNVQTTTTLLARIVIAKIEDEQRLVNIFRNTRVIQNDPNWRCRTWVADVLSTLARDGRAVGTSQLAWEKIEQLARDYVAKKNAAGRYDRAEDMASPSQRGTCLRGRRTCLRPRECLGVFLSEQCRFDLCSCELCN